MSGTSDGQSDFKREGGISTLDLAELPAVQRKIIRVMLREVEATYATLCQRLDALPEGDRIGRAELDQGLAWLSDQQWLIQEMVEQETKYKVNFHHKTKRTLPDVTVRRRSNATMKNIWNALESDRPAGAPAEQDEGA